MAITGTDSKIILIGEDDPDDQELLKEIFSSVDDSYLLVFNSNASQLLTYLHKNENELPCLIILDYNMPGLNGAEILEELNQINKFKAIPKIIWSTSRSNTYRDTCKELGAIDYIVKPSRMKDLLDVARYMLSFAVSR